MCYSVFRIKNLILIISVIFYNIYGIIIKMNEKQTDQFNFEKIITDLEKALKKLKDGNLSYRIHNTFDNKKINSLLNTFNNMADSFDQKCRHQQQIDQKLIESEKRYHAFVCHSCEGIYRIDIIPPVSIDLSSFEIINYINKYAVVGEVNDALADMYGITPEEMVGKPAVGFAPNYGKRAELVLHDKNFQVVNEETIDIDKDDAPLFLMESYHGNVEDGKLSCIWGVQHNIAERKQTEEELKEIKALLEAVFEQSPIPMVMASAPDGILEIINPASRKILGIERERNYISRSVYKIKQSWQDFLPDGTQIALEDLPLAKALEGIETRNKEIKVVRKDGTVRWEVVDGVPIYNAENKLMGGFIIFPDITERKLAEEQIQNDLKEKEIMLKEINHRVKNNLNVVASLLNLQSTRIKSKEQALTAFKESRDRIYAMALVHEKLYQTGDFSSIDMKSYLNDISSQLLNVYMPDNRILIKASVKDVLLNINIAIPCGLIINELVTNAIKHAFPGNRAGIVKVDLKKLKNKSYQLVVSDNGIGVSDKIIKGDLDSLGMELVRLLVGQINGTLVMNNKSGTQFKIVFVVTEDEFY